jgi:hypothetical protein
MDLRNRDPSTMPVIKKTPNNRSKLPAQGAASDWPASAGEISDIAAAATGIAAK